MAREQASDGIGGDLLGRARDTAVWVHVFLVIVSTAAWVAAMATPLPRWSDEISQGRTLGQIAGLPWWVGSQVLPRVHWPQGTPALVYDDAVLTSLLLPAWINLGLHLWWWRGRRR